MNSNRLHKLISAGLVVLIGVITIFNSPQTARAGGVVGTGNPGSCTEAAFVAALAGGGTVTFNCGGAPHTIILTSYKVITADTEIDGNNLITLSGGNATAIFMVSSTATLTLRNIILTHALSGFGTIRNFGTLNLIGSQITYGHSTSSGGAIENYGEVTIANSVVAQNSADIAAGAIMNDWGEVTIQNSQVHSNTAYDNSGAIKNNFGTMQIHNSQIYGNQSLDCASDSYGGGIMNSGTLTVTQSSVSNNQSSYGGGVYNSGAIYLDDIAVNGNKIYGACYGNGGGMVNAAQALVVNSVFSENIGSSYGGGLYNQSNSQMTITDSTFTQNQTWGGGAISNSGTLTLTNSTVYTNTATYGGGIANGISGGTPNNIRLENVTVNDNLSLGSGGGLQTDSGTTTVIYGTFTNNRGESGIEQFGGQLIFKNSIVASNSPKNCEGTITSQGFNISSDYYCGFNQPGDHLNTDPKIGPLMNNGGPTLTHLPQAESPAIDGGQCVAGIAIDQRGVLRPQGAACDIGTVEVVPTRYVYLPIIIRE